MQIIFNYIQEWYTSGPNIVNMIKKELKELLIKDGVRNFAEIIGKNSDLNLINLTISLSHPI